jgi:hypothetical protein
MQKLPHHHQVLLVIWKGIVNLVFSVKPFLPIKKKDLGKIFFSKPGNNEL